MEYRVVARTEGAYLAAEPAAEPLRTEQDALDSIGACFGHGVDRLLLHEGSLSEDFFRLGTGVAGNLLQKFINYRIKAAAVVADERVVVGKAKEMLAELHKGRDFRVFADPDAAERWLLDKA